ncbi:MAG: hypothetical protein KBF88_13625 [Polyangiaceae bacterium]|nr:hypothetical protein [Polyangiaceae bacterium]
MSQLKGSKFLTLLDKRREAAFRSLGTLSPHVISRLVPGAVPWPNSALGKFRHIRRETDEILITDGLSDPYDSELHAAPPSGPCDFELCLPVASDHPSASDEENFASSIWPKLLYPLADAIVEDWIDVRGLLEKFGAITLQAAIGRGFGHGFEKEGLVGYLLGMPLDGDNFDRQRYVNGFYEGLPVPYSNAAIGIFPVKVLKPTELAWAMAQGNDGAMLLAREFVRREKGCRNDDRLAPLH